jgi:predicted ATPase
MLLFVSPDPDALRRYTDKPRTDHSKRIHGYEFGFAPNINDVPSILWNMCQDDKGRLELETWLAEFCGAEIDAIDFEVTESEQILLRVTEQGGLRHTARSMSDGTLSFLYLLALVRTQPSGSLLVLEDIDQGLHPSRAALLAEAIASTHEQRARQSKGQDELPMIVATTHSPHFAEAAAALRSAQILHVSRDDSTQASRIRDVHQLSGYDKISKDRDFAYLMNTGWLDQAD